jgi:hypothetical protein
VRDPATFAAQAALAASLTLTPMIGARAAEPSGPDVAARAYWDKVVATCGGATYLYDVYNGVYDSPRLDELKGSVSYRIEMDPPTPAERLNGMEWRAITSIRSTVWRTRYPRSTGKDGRWEPWGDDAQLFVHIQNLNGRVTFNGLELSQIHDRPSCNGPEVAEDQPLQPPTAAQAALQLEQYYMGVPWGQTARPGESWFIANAPIHTQPDIHSPVIGYANPAEAVPFLGWDNLKWGHIRILGGDGRLADGYVVSNFFRWSE